MLSMTRKRSLPGWPRWLTTRRHFHTLSLRNQQLIAMQPRTPFSGSTIASDLDAIVSANAYESRTADETQKHHARGRGPRSA
jgi:hypothetical protein